MVYRIGVPIVTITEFDVVVQLCSYRLLDMQALIKALRSDPDIAVIDPAFSSSVIQICISTGCDFISFFNGFGKVTFLATLFEYSGFICSTRFKLQVYWQLVTPIQMDLYLF